MKTVIFLCFLLVSLCISQPTTKPETAGTPETKAISVNTEKSATNNNVTATAPAEVPHTTNVTSQTQATSAPAAKESKENATKNDTKAPSTNKVEPAKKQEQKSTESSMVPAAHETKPAAETITESSIVDKKANITKITTTMKPTEEPREVTDKPFVQSRGFDGASFVGGIILTLGLLAIGFMGFKYYKNQTERNYHTL